MSTTLKVKACASCIAFNAGELDNGQLGTERVQEIFEGFSHWKEYELTPGEWSDRELLHDTLCGICHNSLTGDRRRHDDGQVTQDRRAQFGGDRRTQSEDRRRHNDNNVASDRRAQFGGDRRAQSEDRRSYNEDNVASDRRAQFGGDRRRPFSRGSRILLASLRTG